MNHSLESSRPGYLRSIAARGLLGFALLLVPAAALHAQPATDIELELVLSGMSATLDLKNAGDDRLFAVGQNGLIQVVTFDEEGVATLLPTPFLDISTLISAGGERGLLGIAFHPEYAGNGYFFVNYTCLTAMQPECASDGDTIIARYTVSADPNLADPGSALVMATIPQNASNHNGGGLQFEPFPIPEDDRSILYIGMGDGGGGNDPDQNAQNLGTLLGKMLRVDVDNPGVALPRWNIPADNPVIPGALDEIWAYGLRNPWRFSFDRLTGDLLIGDVGQNAREEIDFQPAASPGGENYGWRQCEGTRVNFPLEAPDGCTGGGGLTPPILEYPHGAGCQSVTGGYVYRGAAFDTELGGTYFYADYCTGDLWGARPDGGGGWSNEIIEDTGLTFSITTFGESHDGELYLATNDGELYRIRPPAAPNPDLTVQSVDGPLYGFLGEVINVASTTTRNLGIVSAGASTVGFYFTTDPDGQPDQSFSGSTCAVPVLAGGADYTCTDTVVDVPAALPAGTYNLVAIADDLDGVAESDESNNDLADPQPIELIDCDNPGPELCVDQIDNDCDGFVDGADSDCQAACFPQGASCSIDSECCSLKCRGGNNKTCKGDAACTVTENPEVSCSDGQDNDCDGLVDLADPDCQGPCIPDEASELTCDDGIDNDCDGLIDTDDPDCPLSCALKGDACTVNSDCCSNKCRGPAGGKSCK
jgi:glucose/arabinose dehydrogenase